MLSPDTPIQRKLMTMMLLVSSTVILLTCSAFVGYELATYRGTAVRELETIGQIIAAESTGALAFDNQNDATEVLAALARERQIVAACLYDRNGRVFAHYPASAAGSDYPAVTPPPGHRFSGGVLVSTTPVVQVAGQQPLGTLYLKSNLAATYERLRLYGFISLGVILGTSLVAYFIARKLQRQISGPIRTLAATAQSVSEHGDYSVRAPRLGADELGMLTDTFNAMLEQIEAASSVLETRVRERTAELEAANNELEAFCSSAAHDLRTPLRAITGFADVLLDERGGSLPPEKSKYVRLIRSGSDQMNQLIHDLLNFSRLGRQELSRRPVALEPLCREVLAEVRDELRLGNFDVRLLGLGTVEADPGLLRVVFSNLISNVIKYTRGRNPALLEIGIVPGPGTPPTIYVRDNGVGFDMKDADKLFGVFQRLHHAHEFEGTGVGLATVRRIIERHGGRIWAQATPNQGATFFFTIPPPSQTGNEFTAT